LVHLPDNLRQALASTAAGQFPQGVFQSLPTLRGHPKVSAAQQPVPEELAFADVPNGALLTVDVEFEPLLNELGRARHHPLSSRFRLHVDVTVVGVPAKPVTAFFQFFVQVVQQYVRQQWTDDPSYTVDNLAIQRFRSQLLREWNGGS
jgi:hypothetical protein